MIDDETSVVLSGNRQMAWVASRAEWEQSYETWAAHMSRIRVLTGDLDRIDLDAPPTTADQWIRMASQAKALSDLALMMREETVRVMVSSLGYTARAAAEEVGISPATAARWTQGMKRPS